MKSLVYLLSLILLFTFASANDGEMVFDKVGTISITTTGTDSLLVPMFSSDEWNNVNAQSKSADQVRIPNKDAGWGLYVYPQIISASTEGAITVTYRRADWNYVSEDSSTTSLVTGWSWEHNRPKVFDISQGMPVPFLWVIVERTSGDGVAGFELWSAYRR